MAMVSKDIFDEIDISPKGDVFDQIEYSPKQNQFARKAKIGGKALAKGALGTYGDILDIAGLNPREQLPGEKVRREAEFNVLNKMQQPGYKPSARDLLALSEEDEIAPTSLRLPTSRDVEALLGKERPEGFAEELLERGGKAIGGGLALGGGAKTLGSLLAGSTVGAGAKALGAPEAVADIADVATSLLAGKPSGKLLPKKAQKDLVDKLRAKGFTDKEITPLLQGKRKLNLLGKLSAKGPRTEKSLEGLREKRGVIYDKIRKESDKLGGLSEEGLNKFEASLGDTLDKIPKDYRRLINDDLHDLSTGPYAAQDLIDFYQAISRRVKGQEGGKAILGKLKGPVKSALHDISPELASDFELANEIYGKYKNVAKALKPSQIDDLYKVGKVYGLLGALYSGNLPVITTVLSTMGAKELAREALLNPRFHNLSGQILYQIKKNSSTGIRNAMDKFLNHLEKTDPALFEELHKIDIQEA